MPRKEPFMIPILKTSLLSQTLCFLFGHLPSRLLNSTDIWFALGKSQFQSVFLILSHILSQKEWDTYPTSYQKSSLGSSFQFSDSFWPSLIFLWVVVDVDELGGGPCT